MFDCGYCSEDSFGATAWFVARPAGNVMVDSPRFTPALAAPVRGDGRRRTTSLLTHRDDVADAERWAEQLGARVWIHADDARAAPFATDLIEGAGEPAVIRPADRPCRCPATRVAASRSAATFAGRSGAGRSRDGRPPRSAAPVPSASRSRRPSRDPRARPSQGARAPGPRSARSPARRPRRGRPPSASGRRTRCPPRAGRARLPLCRAGRLWRGRSAASHSATRTSG